MGRFDYESDWDADDIRMFKFLGVNDYNQNIIKVKNVKK